MQTGLEIFFERHPTTDRPWLFDPTRFVTYRDAQLVTIRLAKILAKTVGQGELVGSLIHHGIDAALVMLASNLAGVPVTFIDRSQPEAQLSEVLATEGCALLLSYPSEADFATRLAGQRFPVRILADHDFTASRSFPADDWPTSFPDPDAPACVVFSSGTTGRPKGVVRTVASLTGSGLRQSSRQSLTPLDVIAEPSSYRFVTPATTLYVALVSGCKISFPTSISDGLRDMPTWIKTSGSTVLRSQAAVMRTLLEVEADLRHTRLRLYAVAGETMFGSDIGRLRKILPAFCEIHCGYGSTEAGGLGSTRFAPTDAVPEGRVRFPRKESTLVVDHNLDIVPSGVVGEIVSATARSPGYWRRESLTDERYVQRPDGSRWFRTGDLGRVTEDDMLEVLGRSDSQVKVRGHNVELTEVEAELLTHDEVRLAAVVDVPRPGGGRSLVAFYVPVFGKLPPVASLRRHLAERLSNYKIPSRFVAMDRLPSTVSGKFDREAMRVVSVFDADREIHEPSTDTQRTLHRKLGDMLALSSLSIDDDFFDVGGDSLSAMEFGIWISRHFETGIAMTALVTHPTIAQLAQLIDEGPGEQKEIERSTAVVLRDATAPSATLVLIPGGGDSIVSARPLALALESNVRVIAVQGLGLFDDHDSDPSVVAFAARAIHEAIGLAPTGPYFVGGHSLGGNIAQEMARQMEAAGLIVEAVVLLDSAAPRSFSRPGRLHPLTRWRRAGMQRRQSIQEAQSTSASTRSLVQTRQGKVFERHSMALRNHRAVPCHAPIWLIRAVGDSPLAPDGRDRFANWSGLSRSEVVVLPTPGTHVSIKNDPHVRGVARHIDAQIAQHSASARPTTDRPLRDGRRR